LRGFSAQEKYLFSFLIGVHKCSVGEIASMESMSLSASNSRGNSGTGSLVKRKKNKKSFHKVDFCSRYDQIPRKCQNLSKMSKFLVLREKNPPNIS
jgi:hypothetical protein